jgi:peptidyl-prolyl cis-trans isomerase D
MLIQMRSKAAKAVTFLLFALLILSFAIWGIGDIFRVGGQATVVAEVGAVKITQNEFSRDLSREMNTLRQRFGGQFDIVQAQALGIVDQILEQMITRALFEQKAEDLRMLVGDDEVRKHIRELPVFQDELGNFDRFRFEQILRSNSLSEAQFVATLSNDINRQQIIEAITGASAAPRVLAEALYAYQQERRVAETLSVSADDLPALGEPSAEDLEKVHEEYAGRFRAPEYRSLTLIHIVAEDLAKEVSVSDEELREEFESRRDEFGQPEKRGVAQIVLPNEAAALAAKALLDDGKGFSEVAQSILGRDPVDLGMVSHEDLDVQLPELAKAAFALDARAFAGPIESPFGWHILQVKAIEPGKEPDFEAAREELTRELALREAVDTMVSIANDLDEELGSGASFEEAAGLLQLELRSIPAIDAGGKDPEGKAIAGLPPLGEFSQVAFETEVGRESLLIETRDGDFFALRVDGVTPAATRPLEEVRDQVVALWKDLEQDRLTRERAEALAKRIEDGESLAAVAESEGLTVTATEPVTRQQTESAGLPSRELSAKLFEIAKGEVTTAPAGNGYVVARLTEIQPADVAAGAEAVDGLQDSLARSLQSDLLAGFIETLRERMGVSINERVVEETTSTL